MSRQAQASYTKNEISRMLALIDNDDTPLELEHPISDIDDTSLVHLLNDRSCASSGRSSLASSSSRTSRSISPHVSHHLDDEVIQLLAKQQTLVTKLNHENIALINENRALKQQLAKADRQATQSLIEQNDSLKQQLAISQVYNVTYLNQIRSSNRELAHANGRLAKAGTIIHHLSKNKTHLAKWFYCFCSIFTCLYFSPHVSISRHFYIFYK